MEAFKSISGEERASEETLEDWSAPQQTGRKTCGPPDAAAEVR